MDAIHIRKWTPQNSITLARAACACLGGGLALWGMAPVLVNRVVSQGPVDSPLVTVNGMMMLVGVIFILLQHVFAQGRRWAMWSAFVLASLLAGAALAVVFAGFHHVASTFSIVLTGWTAFATWLGLAAQTQLAGASVAPATPPDAPSERADASPAE